MYILRTQSRAILMLLQFPDLKGKKINKKEGKAKSLKKKICTPNSNRVFK